MHILEENSLHRSELNLPPPSVPHSPKLKPPLPQANS